MEIEFGHKPPLSLGLVLHLSLLTVAKALFRPVLIGLSVFLKSPTMYPFRIDRLLFALPLRFAKDKHPEQQDDTQLDAKLHEAEQGTRVNKELPGEINGIGTKASKNGKADDVADPAHAGVRRHGRAQVFRSALGAGLRRAWILVTARAEFDAVAAAAEVAERRVACGELPAIVAVPHWFGLLS